MVNVAAAVAAAAGSDWTLDFTVKIAADASQPARQLDCGLTTAMTIALSTVEEAVAVVESAEAADCTVASSVVAADVVPILEADSDVVPILAADSAVASAVADAAGA